MTRNYVNDIMSIKELWTQGKPVLFAKSTTYGATPLRPPRNLEMQDDGHGNSRKVNYIYILTNAGMPSSPAAARTLFLSAAQNTREQCGGKHTDHSRQEPAVGLSKEQQPRQKANGKAAACNGKRGGQFFSCDMLRSQKAAEENCGKAYTAGSCRKLRLIDQTAKHESCTQRRQEQQRGACNGKTLQNGAQKAPVPEL